MLGFSLLAGGFRDPILTVFHVFWNKVCVVHACLQVIFLVIFGSESGCLGLEKQAFGKKVLQKSTFAEVGFLIILGYIFHHFG